MCQAFSRQGAALSGCSLSVCLAAPVVPSWPMSTTTDVWRPVAKELSTAFFAMNTAGGRCFSNISCRQSTAVLHCGKATQRLDFSGPAGGWVADQTPWPASSST